MSSILFDCARQSNSIIRLIRLSSINWRMFDYIPRVKRKHQPRTKCFDPWKEQGYSTSLTCPYSIKVFLLQTTIVQLMRSRRQLKALVPTPSRNTCTNSFNMAANLEPRVSPAPCQRFPATNRGQRAVETLGSRLYGCSHPSCVFEVFEVHFGSVCDKVRHTPAKLRPIQSSG